MAGSVTQTAVIRAQEVTKRFGPTLALDRLSLLVPAGSVLGLLGPNGAGKTTFLRLVMGFLFPEGGRIEREELGTSQIGYLPERAFYPPRSRVVDYLMVIGRLAGLQGQPLRRHVQRLIVDMGLEDASERHLGRCSRGMLQRVGLAQALLGDPPLLLFDEPMIGLDPAAQRFMRDQIVALNQSGKTVVLSSHNLSDVARVCTHVAMLSRGRLVRGGRLDEMLARPAEVTIVTGPMPARLPSDLRGLAPGVLASDGRVRLVGDAVQRKADVLRTLLDAGVDIQGMTEQRATLEEVFLEATEA
jgi:ABC-2 type transport system ATP-binding protein